MEKEILRGTLSLLRRARLQALNTHVRACMRAHVHVFTFTLRPVFELFKGDALRLALLQFRYNVSLVHGDNVHLLALGDKVHELVPVDPQTKKWQEEDQNSSKLGGERGETGNHPPSRARGGRSSLLRRACSGGECVHCCQEHALDLLEPPPNLSGKVDVQASPVGEEETTTRAQGDLSIQYNQAESYCMGHTTWPKVSGPECFHQSPHHGFSPHHPPCVVAPPLQQIVARSIVCQGYGLGSASNHQG